MPELSVIICTHNRSGLVTALVKSFNQQRGLNKDDVELIIVASACSDDTVTSISSIRPTIDAKVVVVDVKEPGLSLARNFGLDKATKPYIAFLDDDVRLYPGWIEGLYEVFSGKEYDVVGGRIMLWWDNVDEPDWIHHYHRRLLGFNEHGTVIKPIEGGNIFGGNFAISRDVYNKVGLFSTNFGRKGMDRLAGEEADYFMRAKKLGFKFVYTPNAAVEHLVNSERASIEYLTRSAFGVGQTRILLPNQIDKVDIQLIFRKLQALFQEAVSEMASTETPVDYMFHKTRRFDVLGECIGVLKHLFGEIYPTNNKINPSTLQKGIQAIQSIENDIDYLNDKKSGIRISIIIPCYNCEDLVGICLESALRQTLDARLFEVICVNDCSTDDSIKVINSYLSKIKNLKIVEHSINRKQGAARNSGIELSVGQYITFLDADDYLTPDALEVFLRNAGDNDLVIAQHVVTHDKEGKQVEKKSNRRLIGDISNSVLSGAAGWWPFGVLIARNLLNEGEIKFREGVFFEDIDFLARVSLASNNCSVINNVVYKYVVHPESTVNSLNEKKLSDSAEAVLEVFKLISELPLAKKQCWVESSSKWLLYQIERVVLQNKNISERATLHEVFLIELTANRLWRLYPSQFHVEAINRITQSLVSPANNNSDPQGLQIDAPGSLSIANRLFQFGVYSAALFIYENLCSMSPAYRFIQYNADACRKRIDQALVEKQDLGKMVSLRPKEIDYLFIPHNRYHAENLAQVVVALNKHGLNCKILMVSPPHPNEGAYLAEYGSHYVGISMLMYEELIPRGIVVMNDWESRIAAKLVMWANSRGIATYAIVEGVNDYHDVDTRKQRRAYQRVSNLLLNGEFDKKYFKDSSQRIDVVGIFRLDRLYERVTQHNAPITKSRTAVINCNFTYNVLADRAQSWVNDVITACKSFAIEYVVSKHPADITNISREKLTSRPMYDEIIDSEIFITRFSGAVFEALVAGCKVIYYNPDMEKIDKFIDPMGAFLYARSSEDLASCFRKISEGWSPNIHDFLRLHVASGYDSSHISDNSLKRTVKILLDDADRNRDKAKKDQAGGHIYFEKIFNKWRSEKWAKAYYVAPLA
jgi:glycosyltransferase involved in cell wall biosynthesis